MPPTWAQFHYLQRFGTVAEALEALQLRDDEERRMQDRWSLIEEDALKAMHVDGRIDSF